MDDLLDLAICGHGGTARWETFSWFRAEASITGAIWALKGKAGILDSVVLEGETRDQRLRIDPFPGSGRYTTWEPRRQTIESSHGVVLEERLDPGASFAGQVRETPWDDLHAAYFASEANWNYFVAPFIFTRSDFVVVEVDPWREQDEVWRSLLVTYPEQIVAHTRQQTYRFDDKGLLRRLDYSVDILGGGRAVHYPSDYRDFAGIMVPTRRRVYVRNADGSPALGSVSIAIDIDHIDFG